MLNTISLWFKLSFPWLQVSWSSFSNEVFAIHISYSEKYLLASFANFAVGITAFFLLTVVHSTPPVDVSSTDIQWDPKDLNCFKCTRIHCHPTNRLCYCLILKRPPVSFGWEVQEAQVLPAISLGEELSSYPLSEMERSHRSLHEA